MDDWLTEADAGTIITVWVVPGSSRSSIDGPHGDALKVRVTAPAERGRANAALLELLGASLGGARVSLVAGSSVRRKQVFVPGLDPDGVRRQLVG